MTGGGRYPGGGYTGLGAFPDRRGPGRHFFLGLGVLLGALLTAGVILLLEPGSAGRAQPASVASGSHLPYRPGTCIYETPGSGPGSVALRVTDCGGRDAVFVIDHVAADGDGCARRADYASYGLIQPDTSARSVYCMSLVVPRDACLRTVAGVAPQRVACAADTRRVAEIRAASDPATACSGLPGADPWLHRGPDSGRIACVVPESG